MRTRYLLFGLLLLILATTVNAVTNVSTCTNLTTAGETYTLNTTLSGNQSSGVCVDIQNNNIILDCQGKSISGPGIGSGDTKGIRAQNVRNITIQNCPAIIYDYAYNIYLSNVNDSRIDNVLSDNAYTCSGFLCGGDGLRIENGVNINVTNSVFGTNTAAGVFSIGSSNTLIKNTWFQANNNFGLGLLASTSTTVQSCNFTNVSIRGDYGIAQFSSSSNTYVNDTRIYGHNIAGVYSDTSDNLIVNNSRFGVGGDAGSNNNRSIWLFTSDAATIERNNFTFGSTRENYSIYLDTSNWATIRQNNFNATGYGIYMTEGGNINIINNTFRNVSLSRIYFYNYWGGNLIENNTDTSYPGTYGAYFTGKHDAVVDNVRFNYFNNSVNTGIGVLNVNRINFIGNTIGNVTGGFAAGIVTLNITNCTISGNNISNVNFGGIAVGDYFGASQSYARDLNISDNTLNLVANQLGIILITTNITGGSHTDISNNNIRNPAVGIQLTGVVGDTSTIRIYGNNMSNLSNTGGAAEAQGILYGLYNPADPGFQGTISGNTIDSVGVSGSGVAYASRGIDGYFGSNAVITGNRISNISKGIGMRIIGFDIYNTAQHTLARNINISGNVIDGPADSNNSFNFGLYLNGFANSTVTYNNISHPQGGEDTDVSIGIFCIGCVDSNITNNRLTYLERNIGAVAIWVNPYSDALMDYNTSNLLIDNNVIYRADNGIDVVAQNSNKIRITHNDISSIKRKCIYFTDAGSITIENNTIYNADQSPSSTFGIYGYNTVTGFTIRDVNVTNNTITNVSNGIVFDAASPISYISTSNVQNNTITGPFQNSIYVNNLLLTVVGRFNLLSNRINGLGVSPYGIRIENSKLVVAQYNNVRGVNYGFFINKSNTTYVDTGNFNANDYGLSIYNSNTTYFGGINIFGNSQYGLYIVDSNDTTEMGFTHFYNNGLADLYINSSNVAGSFALTYAAFDNPAGNMQNFTYVTLSDSLTTGETYTMRWTQNSTKLPDGYASFRQKYVNITALSGTPSINT
ncbi:MAG: right-handed parallel beta-helix repeat-containing protein, partial [Candidatus Micrarchaeota archaeon]